MSGAASGVDVLEIGPGLGVVTAELARAGSRVVCVEADRELVPILREAVGGLDVEVVAEDFLKLNVPEFLHERGGGKWAVVGNLPYYITSPIIEKLIDARAMVSSVLLMVQKEVAARLQAGPGTNDYGSLSVFVQFYYDVCSVMRVSRKVFYPVPEVDSELVKLTVREEPVTEVPDEKLFFLIVRAAFGKRRKTLLNALGSSMELGWNKERARKALARAGIDAERRGETLSIGEFAQIACSTEV